MTVRQPHYGKEEFAQRGNEIYQFQVRSQVEVDNHDKIVAITYFVQLRVCLRKSAATPTTLKSEPLR